MTMEIDLCPDMCCTVAGSTFPWTRYETAVWRRACVSFPLEGAVERGEVAVVNMELLVFRMELDTPEPLGGDEGEYGVLPDRRFERQRHAP
jgi:hypothetical protein